jgi:hypothetical protein
VSAGGGRLQRPAVTDRRYKTKKMSLLTELEILGAGFLQRWRAYGAADAMSEVDIKCELDEYFNCSIINEDKDTVSCANETQFTVQGRPSPVSVPKF